MAQEFAFTMTVKHKDADNSKAWEEEQIYSKSDPGYYHEDPHTNQYMSWWDYCLSVGVAETAEKIVKRFNATLRPSEKPRVLVKVEDHTDYGE